MKLNSKYFDSIRVSGTRGRRHSSRQEGAAPSCQWKNCTKRGLHRAPKGRAWEGEYYYFCRDHVTEYNKSYNYFSGMNDAEVANYHKSATTGHRPTWSMGVNGTDAHGWESLRRGRPDIIAEDPLDVLKAIHGRLRERRNAAQTRHRLVLKGARKHLNALNLDENATSNEIKVQFKALVKLHHPDHNGGDRSSEERFREVLTAYNYLKQAGLVR